MIRQLTHPPAPRTCNESESNCGKIDAHVVVLTNFLGPHHLKQMREFQRRVRRLSILVSTVMEPNRDWPPDWQGLDIKVQENRTITRRWRHAGGFEEDNYIHIPWDTGLRLRALRPDVILSYEMGLRTLFSSIYRARDPNCRLVTVCNMSDHTEQGRGRLRDWLRSRLRDRVDLVTSNGPGCTRYLLGKGYPRDRIVPFRYCHDPEKVYDGPRSFSDFPSKLFHCGSLSARKGIVPFCKALVEWCRGNPERSIQLTLAGHGPEESVIEKMQRPANLEFRLPGSVDAATIRETYGACDLVVFPTLADEWGLVVNEALGSGTPILASVLAQASEVLCRDGENSWLFDPRQPGEMESVLDRALNTSPSRLMEMSEAARRSVDGLTVESSGDEFVHIVNTALRLRDSGPTRPLTPTPETRLSLK